VRSARWRENVGIPSESRRTARAAMPSRPSRAVTAPPAGLVYEAHLLSLEAERDALAAIESLTFNEIRMHGVVAKRTARHFGFDYDYERRGLIQEAEPVPDWILPVRERAAALAGLEPEALVEALVQRYPEGAQIGWHRDAPMFGTVVGVSLLASSRMRFRRDVGAEREVYELELAPRSGYVLADEARTKWQHHVPPTKDLRYSITFRTLRNPDRWKKPPPPR
jgi:alkylated DNA repair dioxygenase AlkB